jgi:beta-lactamase regulating signal transducer with metallopeptidase domain
MSFITYVLSTILLSWVGGLVYLGFRWAHPGARARRGMIWLVLALSLLAPLTPPFFQHSHSVATNSANKAAVSTGTVIAPVPVGTANINDFCHCAEPHAGDVLLYQASRVYDWLLANRTVIAWIQIVVTMLVLARLLLGLGRLMRVTWRHRRERIEIDGEKLWLVRDVPRLTAGSLRLGGKFIFWHRSLDALDPRERHAILWHEHAHIRHRNTLEKLFFGLIQSIWLLNPVYYWMSRELELLSEYMADEYAASRYGDRKGYARLLLAVKSERHFAPVHFFSGSSLKSRVKTVLKKEKPGRIHYLPAFFIGLLFLFPGDLFTQDLIREQIRDIEVYKFLSEQNHETGKTEFCRKCTYEAVEQVCY